MNLINYKTTGGSIVIEKVCIDDKNYKWKLICGKCKNNYLSTKRIITDKNKIGLCTSCIRKQTSPNRLNLEGERIGRWHVVLQSNIRDKHGNVRYECVCDCGQIRLVSGSILKSNKSLSCGCLQIDIAKSLNGEKSPRWKGGREKKRSEYLNREDGQRQALRKYIYKRDCYSCVICKSTKRPIAHHMNAWGIFPEGRYEETNLITVCEIHHKEFHKLYGNGSNTVSQFENYYNTFKLDILFEELLGNFDIYKKENGFPVLDTYIIRVAGSST